MTHKDLTLSDLLENGRQSRMESLLSSLPSLLSTALRNRFCGRPIKLVPLKLSIHQSYESAR